MKLIVIAVLLIVGVSIPMRKKENSKCKIEGIVVPIGTTMPIVMFSFMGQRQKIFLTVMNKSINKHLKVKEQDMFYSDNKTKDLWYSSIVFRRRIYNKYQDIINQCKSINAEIQKKGSKYEKYRIYSLPSYIEYKHTQKKKKNKYYIK